MEIVRALSGAKKTESFIQRNRATKKGRGAEIQALAFPRGREILDTIHEELTYPMTSC